MTDRLDPIKALIGGLTLDERQAFFAWFRAQMPLHPLEARWGVSADVVLNAIERSADLTQRGIRGVIAEAIFEAVVIPTVRQWKSEPVAGEAYDFLLTSGPNQARVQVKLQRLERQKPKFAGRPYPPGMYVVEVQRTRGGVDRKTGKATRPYAFGEFDVLAVNLHPSSGKWENFLFTAAAWLVPRRDNKRLMAIMQPVPPIPNQHWTSDLNECLEWHRSARRGRIFTPPRGSKPARLD